MSPLIPGAAAWKDTPYGKAATSSTQGGLPRKVTVAFMETG